MTSIYIPGGWEWLVVLFIGMLLFGNNLPKLARSLGSSIIEFKKGLRGEGDEGRTGNTLSQEDRKALPEDEEEVRSDRETTRSSDDQ